MSEGIPTPNYTQIPNIILDNLDKLSDVELRVMLVTCRQTLGWHRDNAPLSIGYLVATTGMSKQGVINGVHGNIKRKWLQRVGSGKRGVSVYGMNFSDLSTELTRSSQPSGQEHVKPVDTVKKGKERLKKKDLPHATSAVETDPSPNTIQSHNDEMEEFPDCAEDTVFDEHRNTTPHSDNELAAIRESYIHENVRALKSAVADMPAIPLIPTRSVDPFEDKNLNGAPPANLTDVPPGNATNRAANPTDREWSILGHALYYQRGTQVGHTACYSADVPRMSVYVNAGILETLKSPGRFKLTDMGRAWVHEHIPSRWREEGLKAQAKWERQQADKAERKEARRIQPARPKNKRRYHVEATIEPMYTRINEHWGCRPATPEDLSDDEHNARVMQARQLAALSTPPTGDEIAGVWSYCKDAFDKPFTVRVLSKHLQNYRDNASPTTNAHEMVLEEDCAPLDASANIAYTMKEA